MQTYRTNQLTLKPIERRLLGQALTRDGVTYLLAILCKTIQENSGYLEARQQRRRERQAQAQVSPPRSTRNPATGAGPDNNLEFAVARSPAGATKFTFNGNASRNSAAAHSGAQSSYEYYEESEEEPDLNSLQNVEVPSARGGLKQPDPASALINIQNERADLESEEKFKLYVDTITELYELLNMDPYLLDNFKTSPGLLKHFYLTKLIMSDRIDEKNLGVKIALLLYRFDDNTRLQDISGDPEAIEILQK